MAYNRFQATAAQVIDLYPGTVAADYGGNPIIEGAIDRAVDRIAAALPANVYEQLITPRLVRVIRRSTSGQATAQLPAFLLPVVAGSFELWIGGLGAWDVRPPVPGTGDDGTLYSLNITSGLITFTPTLTEKLEVFASWDVNQSSPTAWNMPSLARLAVRGAAAELGARLYTQATQEWALVESYRASFADDLQAMADGTRVPDELRAISHWKEVERGTAGGGGKASTIDLLRG